MSQRTLNAANQVAAPSGSIEYAPSPTEYPPIFIALHEFGTHEPPMSAYPTAEHVTAPAVSAPLVETAPFAQEKFCEYARLPPVTAELELAVEVAPWLNAPTE